MNDQDLESQGYSPKRDYINRINGELFYLRIVNKPGADGIERPVYQLKNIIHYWEGTAEQFKAAFET